MNTFTTLVVANVVLHSFLVGISYDLSLVKLAARKRVGDDAFAEFIRATDLGSGVVAHTLLGAPAILLSLFTSGYVLVARQPGNLRSLVLAAGVATLAYAACSGKVVPLTFALKSKPKTLERLLDQYAIWCHVRSIFQVITLGFFVGALLTALGQ